MEQLKPLKPAEEKCIQEYLTNGNNQTEAYLTAYPHTKKWKNETVRVKASQFFKRDNIQITLAQLLKPAKEETKISIERTLKETAALAYSDITAIQDKDGNYLSPKEWPEELRSAVKKIKYLSLKDGSGVVVEVQFHDKNQALEKIFKHKGMYEADNMQKAPIIAQLETLPPEVLTVFMEKLRELASQYRPELDGQSSNTSAGSLTSH